jgi:hypothetical protein
MGSSSRTRDDAPQAKSWSYYAKNGGMQGGEGSLSKPDPSYGFEVRDTIAGAASIFLRKVLVYAQRGGMSVSGFLYPGSEERCTWCWGLMGLLWWKRLLGRGGTRWAYAG